MKALQIRSTRVEWDHVEKVRLIKTSLKEQIQLVLASTGAVDKHVTVDGEDVAPLKALLFPNGEDFIGFVDTVGTPAVEKKGKS